MKLKYQKDELDFLFAIWEGIIKFSNLDGRTDNNRISEDIVINIFNELDHTQFENLNTPGACGGIGTFSFSGADIGWLTHEAYEVTSRTDAKKIYECLSSFEKNKLITHFPQGIRFLILGTKKPKPSAAKIKRYQFFNPDIHILSLNDLKIKIPLGGQKDGEVYNRIKKILIDQFVEILPEVFQRQEKDEHLIALVITKTRLVGDIIDDLRSKLGFSRLDTLDFHKIDQVLEQINASGQIPGFENWYVYLKSFKEKLLVNIITIKEYKDIIGKGYLLELLLIENQLLREDIFVGYKKYAVTGLSYASLCFQEIFIHNYLLQKLNQRFDEMHRRSINKAAEEYRKRNYDNYNLQDDFL